MSLGPIHEENLLQTVKELQYLVGVLLARSGLDEKRMVEVAGFADRKLKNPSDPLAPENRRIGILLETGDE